MIHIHYMLKESMAELWDQDFPLDQAMGHPNASVCKWARLSRQGSHNTQYNKGEGGAIIQQNGLGKVKLISLTTCGEQNHISEPVWHWKTSINQSERREGSNIQWQSVTNNKSRMCTVHEEFLCKS